MNQPALDRTLKRPLDRLRILGSMGLRLRKVRKWQKVLLKATFLSFSLLNCFRIRCLFNNIFNNITLKGEFIEGAMFYRFFIMLNE